MEQQKKMQKHELFTRAREEIFLLNGDSEIIGIREDVGTLVSQIIGKLLIRSRHINLLSKEITSHIRRNGYGG